MEDICKGVEFHLASWRTWQHETRYPHLKRYGEYIRDIIKSDEAYSEVMMWLQDAVEAHAFEETKRVREIITELHELLRLKNQQIDDLHTRNLKLTAEARSKGI